MVTSSNKVRIGNSTVTVIEGQVAYSFPSDGRFKTNIKEDVPGLAFINKLRPVTYNFETKKFDEFLHQNDPSFKEIENATDYAPSTQIIESGFIAQEVEKTMQQTGYNFNGVHRPQSEADNYSMSYELMVVPLVKAVQELSKQNDSKDEALEAQQKINADLQKQNDIQQKQIDAILQKLNELQTTQQACCNISGAATQTYNTVITDGAALEQNVPNPFTHTTSIGYTLPQKFTTAQIMITDNSGKTIKLINISGSGKGNLNVDASMLASGAYNYSLLVDGKLIDTKQMVLAK